MRRKTLNGFIIGSGLLTLLTGVELHVGHSTLLNDHTALTIWLTAHIVFASALTIFAVMHIVSNRWWFKTLKLKISSARMTWQRILTPLVALLIAALVVTGVCMLAGWHTKHSHIWEWHYVLGLAWAVIALAHGLAFKLHKMQRSKQKSDAKIS